jgi:hypothetical protein
MANTKITADNIAANAITASSITDGTITAAKLAANSVDSDQYVDGSIDLIHMSVNSIDSDQYVDGSIDTVHIADGSVTSAKLDTNIAIAGTLTTTGEIAANGGIDVTGIVAISGVSGTGYQGQRLYGTGTNYNYMQIDNTGGNINFGVESSSGGSLLSGTSAYATVLSTYTNTALHFGTNNTLRATIDSSGNVGIGTTSPVGKLDVSVASNQRIRFDNFGGTSRISSRNDAAAILPLLIDASDLILNSGSGGNVGIGSTNPAVSLDVGTKTDAIRVPNGTTAQRPTGVNGQIRYNTSINEMEGYINNSWNSFNLSFLANGGTETTATINGTTYKIHAFTSSGTFQVTAGSSQIDVLIVAGGGGGGGSTAGGGGAGGLIYQTGVLASSGSYTITIGAGGTGGRRADLGTPDNTNGSNTTAFSYTAIGGGYGYSGAVSGSRLANSGGSGGGGGAYNGNDIATSSGAAGTSGQGFAGGAATDGGNWGGGGGGGATAVGVDQTGTRAGGAGSNQSGNFGTGYGASGVFAGGGGGGAYLSGVTQGGTGGGGNGGDGQTYVATAGSANTGGGGGGGGYYQNGSGGAGGSGIVIIRYEV